MNDHDLLDTDDLPTSDLPTSGVPASSATKGRVVVVALLAVLGVLAASVGVAVLRPRSSEFCDRVSELPSVTDSVAAEGSPAVGFAESAEAFEQVAAAAPDELVAAAARALADHQRRLGTALVGEASSAEVVSAVAAVDTGSFDDAGRTLDEAIASRCD